MRIAILIKLLNHMWHFFVSQIRNMDIIIYSTSPYCKKSVNCSPSRTFANDYLITNRILHIALSKLIIHVLETRIICK